MTVASTTKHRNLAKSLVVMPALAAALAVGSVFAPPAEAGKTGRFLGGVAVGVIGTAIVANEVRRSRERRAVRRYYHDEHVARCARRYRSYDARTDTYVTRSGRVRRCRL